MSRAAVILATARALVAAPNGWTQGTNARAGLVRRVPVSHSEATCFCSDGAILRAAQALRATGEDVFDARCFLYRAYTGESRRFADRGRAVEAIVSWNDQFGRRQEEVVAAFARAEELAREAKA